MLYKFSSEKKKNKNDIFFSLLAIMWHLWLQFLAFDKCYFYCGPSGQKGTLLTPIRWSVAEVDGRRTLHEHCCPASWWHEPQVQQEQGCLPASSAAPTRSRHQGLQLITLAIVTPQFMAMAELGLSSSSAGIGRETSSWELHSGILNRAKGTILLHDLLCCFPIDCCFNQRWKVAS